MTLQSLTRSVVACVLKGLRACAKLLQLDARKVENSFQKLEPYMETALDISQSVAEATGNKTVAEAVTFAQSKGLPVIEAWLHTNDQDLGSVLLQIGTKLLLKEFPHLTLDDATTAIQNAQRVLRTLPVKEAPARS